MPCRAGPELTDNSDTQQLHCKHRKRRTQRFGTFSEVSFQYVSSTGSHCGPASHPTLGGNPLTGRDFHLTPTDSSPFIIPRTARGWCTVAVGAVSLRRAGTGSGVLRWLVVGRINPTTLIHSDPITPGAACLFLHPVISRAARGRRLPSSCLLFQDGRRRSCVASALSVFAVQGRRAMVQVPHLRSAYERVGACPPVPAGELPLKEVTAPAGVLTHC